MEADFRIPTGTQEEQALSVIAWLRVCNPNTQTGFNVQDLLGLARVDMERAVDTLSRWTKQRNASRPMCANCGKTTVDVRLQICDACDKMCEPVR